MKEKQVISIANINWHFNLKNVSHTSKITLTMDGCQCRWGHANIKFVHYNFINQETCKIFVQKVTCNTEMNIE